MKKFRVGFIGTGNIATAIFSGVTASGYIKSEDVCVFDTVAEKTEPFVRSGASLLSSSYDVVLNSEYVFLAVKPQMYADVLNSIKDAVKETCIVAVAAGISIKFIKTCLGFDASVIRVMPNTPLMYGYGSSALVKTSPVTDEQFDFVQGCFNSCGVTAVVDENMIDTVTAVSGSAPAYVMRFAKNLIDFAVNQGLSHNDAERLILQAFIGSAQMALKSESSLEDLIKMVTSPNGTTAAGLASFDANKFDDIVNAGLKATVNRSKELSK